MGFTVQIDKQELDVCLSGRKGGEVAAVEEGRVGGAVALVEKVYEAGSGIVSWGIVDGSCGPAKGIE